MLKSVCVCVGGVSIPQSAYLLTSCGVAPPWFLACGCDWSQAVSTHFQKKRSGPGLISWWIHSLWYSPDPINFWLYSVEFLLFPGLILIHWVVSVHLQTNHKSDWVQIWWTSSFSAFPSLINFRSNEFSIFPGSWLVKQLPGICRQTADRNELKFGEPNHCGTPLVWAWPG